MALAEFAVWFLLFLALAPLFECFLFCFNFFDLPGGKTFNTDSFNYTDFCFPKRVFFFQNKNDFFGKLEKNPLALPTQLYISLDSPTEEIFKKVNLSLNKNGWKRLHTSLEIFSRLNTRRLFRFTLIKGVNDLESQFEDYKKLIELGKPDFLELKGFVYIGMARKRHTKEQSPTYLDVEEFAKKFASFLGNYEYVSSAPNSLICLLKRKDSKYQIKLENI